MFVCAQAHISGERPRHREHTVTIIPLCACSPGAHVSRFKETVCRVRLMISNVNSLGYCSGATYTDIQMKYYYYNVL